MAKIAGGSKGKAKESKDKAKEWSWSFIENWNRSRLWTIIAALTSMSFLTWAVAVVMGEKRYRLVISGFFELVAIELLWSFAYIPFYLMGFTSGLFPVAYFAASLVITYLAIDRYAEFKKRNPKKKILWVL